LSTHLKANPTFWTPADADYPRLLKEIPDPPAVLYYRGNPALLPKVTTPLSGLWAPATLLTTPSAGLVN
jgi:DNA processing protein